MKSPGHRSLRFRSIARQAQCQSTTTLDAPHGSRFIHATDVFDSKAFHVDAPHTLLRRTLCPPETRPPWHVHHGATTGCTVYLCVCRLDHFFQCPRTFFPQKRPGRPPPSTATNTVKRSTPTRPSSSSGARIVLIGKAVTLRGSCGRPCQWLW